MRVFAVSCVIIVALIVGCIARTAQFGKTPAKVENVEARTAENLKLQDAYFTAWLAEYTNLIEYIHALCTHEQDIAAIDAYDSALREQLKSARILFFTDWRSCTMRSRLRAMTPAGTERAVG